MDCGLQQITMLQGGISMKKLRSDADIARFLIAVKSCQGDVFFESTEGDILNLASTLSQYVFCSLASQPDILSDGSIRCQQEADYEALAQYLT
jgi:hypothetical protein